MPPLVSRCGPDPEKRCMTIAVYSTINFVALMLTIPDSATTHTCKVFVQLFL
jgi:hypothetical protein